MKRLKSSQKGTNRPLTQHSSPSKIIGSLEVTTKIPKPISTFSSQQPLFKSREKFKQIELRLKRYKTLGQDQPFVVGRRTPEDIRNSAQLMIPCALSLKRAQTIQEKQATSLDNGLLKTLESKKKHTLNSSSRITVEQPSDSFQAQRISMHSRCKQQGRRRKDGDERDNFRSIFNSQQIGSFLRKGSPSRYYNYDIVSRVNKNIELNSCKQLDLEETFLNSKWNLLRIRNSLNKRKNTIPAKIRNSLCTNTVRQHQDFQSTNNARKRAATDQMNITIKDFSLKSGTLLRESSHIKFVRYSQISTIVG